MKVEKALELEMLQNEDLLVNSNDRDCNDQNILMEIEEISNYFELVLLQKDDSFADFEKAESYVYKFAEYKDFGVRLRHITATNTVE
ncbi:12300_t:CDS:2, partial [Cetraspora pellucida]